MLNELLIAAAQGFVSEAGSFLIWGEVEVPECLREEIEKRGSV